jgi:hypothetical protein
METEQQQQQQKWSSSIQSDIHKITVKVYMTGTVL